MNPSSLKFGTGLWIFGGSRDRLAAYRDLPSFSDQLKMASQVPGLRGVELQYPRHFEKESPAQTAALLLRCGKLVHVHLNDCYRETDDDLMVGAARVFETVELFHYLARLSYQGWLSLDTVALRGDPVAAATASARAVERLGGLAARIRPERIAEIQARRDPTLAVEFMTEMLR